MNFLFLPQEVTERRVHYVGISQDQATIATNKCEMLTRQTVILCYVYCISLEPGLHSNILTSGVIPSK